MSSTKAKTPWLEGTKDLFTQAIESKPRCTCASKGRTVTVVRKLIPVGQARLSVDTCKRCKGVVR